MRRTMVRLPLLALVTAAAFLGQQPLYTLKVDVPWVTVDVTVTDPSGKTVSDLKAEDFQVFENGVPQQIHAFAPISAPYNVLLLFDRSGSTEHKWAFMQRATAGLITNLRAQDRIAIDSFDFEFESITRWTYKRDLSVAALSELTRSKSIGGTAFYNALETALKNEFKNVSGRRAIVVLTDGRDTSMYKEVISQNRLVVAADDRRFQKTLKTVREQRIPIYFLALNTDLNFEPNTTGGDEYRNLTLIFPNSTLADRYLKEVRTRMEMLASESGGRILYPKEIQDIVPLYERIGRELGSAYSLAYISEDSKADGSLRKIEVRATDGTLRLSQSRTSYYAR
jgi:Ca-activated chloride channel family protein